MLMTQSIPPEAAKPRKATPWQVAKAVFWSFLGIRRRAEHEHDAVTLTPLQVIVAGIIGAVIFVLSLVMLVRYITS
jgi:type IV secretory pathway TrbF-like protein